MKRMFGGNWNRICFAVAAAVVGWTVFAAQNIVGTMTLEADADWRAETVTFEEGAVLNLDGHKLSLGSSGYGGAATISDEVGTGELHIDIPEGTTQESWLSLAGGVKLVKEGAGTYVLKAASRSTGEVVVKAGLMQTGLAGAFPQGTLVVVENGGAFDVCGLLSDLAYQIEGAGPDGQGALRNSGVNIGEGNGQMQGLTLTGDAKVNLQGDFGLVSAGFAANELRLGGHTLTLACNNGKAFWFCNTTCPDAGVIRAEGCAPFFTKGNSSLPDVDFIVTGATFWVRPEVVVKSLTFKGDEETLRIESGNAKLCLEELSILGSFQTWASMNSVCAKGTVLVSNETADVTFNLPVRGWDGQRPSLVKQGAGTLTLAEANQFGDVDIQSGTVVAAGKTPNLALANFAIPMNVAAGAKLDLSACISGTMAFSDLKVAAGGEIVGAESTALLHRWSFDDLTDSIGGSTAVLTGEGPELVDGKLVLKGATGSTGYALLGTGLLPEEGPFTIEIWARQDEIVSWSRLVDIGVGGGQSFAMAWTRGTNINQDQVEHGSYLQDTMAPYTLGTMYHIAVTYDGAGNIAWTKRNLDTGVVEKGSGFSNTQTYWRQPTARFQLGHDLYALDSGSVASATYDEVRVWRGVLSDVQLTAHALAGPADCSQVEIRMANPEVPPEDPELLHRWSFNGDLADSVGGSTAVLTGEGAHVADKQLVLEGGPGYAVLGTGVLPAAGPFTIEVWARQDAVANWSRIIDIGTTGGKSFAVAWTRGTNVNQDQVENGGKYLQDTMAPYTLGTMYHISVTCDGSGWIRWTKRNAATGAVEKNMFFVNTGTDWTSSAARFHLGRDMYDPTTGSVASATYDEVRVWRGVLSEAQLTQNAKDGPDACLTLGERPSGASLVHRWSFTSDTTDAVGGRTGVLNGPGARVEDGMLRLTGGPQGSSWAELGVGLLPSTGPFTIELWARKTADQSNARFLDIGTGQKTSFVMAWYSSASIPDFVEYNGSQYQRTMAPYTMDTMYHIAVVYDGVGTFRWERRDLATGRLERSTSVQGAPLHCTLPNARFWLGHSWYKDLDSSSDYDEVRIWDGALTSAELAQNVLNGPDALFATAPVRAGGMAVTRQAELAAGFAYSGALDLENALSIEVVNPRDFAARPLLDVADGAVEHLRQLSVAFARPPMRSEFVLCGAGELSNNDVKAIALDVSVGGVPQTAWKLRRRDGQVVLLKEGFVVFVR